MIFKYFNYIMLISLMLIPLRKWCSAFFYWILNKSLQLLKNMIMSAIPLAFEENHTNSESRVLKCHENYKGQTKMVWMFNIHRVKSNLFLAKMYVVRATIYKWFYSWYLPIIIFIWIASRPVHICPKDDLLVRCLKKRNCWILVFLVEFSYRFENYQDD